MANQSRYNIGTILEDGREILNIERLSETEYRFLVYCDRCKTEKIVKRTTGLRRQCTGCGGKIWRHETEVEQKANKKFTNYRARAKRKGQDFSLNRTEFLATISQPCHWCGSDGIVGIDRVLNEQGYTLENSVPCCKECNFAKNNMTLTEWLLWIDRLVAHNTKG